MSDIVERLRKAAADFEAICGHEANMIDSDCEPHWSNQVELEEASQTALDAIAEIERLRSITDERKNSEREIASLQYRLEEAEGHLARLSVQEGWRPIAEADNGIAHIIGAAGLHIGNSLPIWARDIDGRIFECLWADDGKRAYWWDIEGESPVDPVEFMPHPLASLRDPKERKE